MQKEIQFQSLDGLTISAITYFIKEDAPFIILCHQANYNKYEYEGIALKLNEKGFNCIAIDQRSGGTIVNMPNETMLRAVQENKGTDFLDAEQDIAAAIKYVSENYNDSSIILWGSSYSATLALYIAIENDAVDAVVSFSPGNYLKEEKGSLIELLKGFKKPIFITSAKHEIPRMLELLEKIELNNKQVHFQPDSKGFHGSRALWPKQNGGEEYWRAIDAFLNNLSYLI